MYLSVLEHECTAFLRNNDPKPHLRISKDLDAQICSCGDFVTVIAVISWYSRRVWQLLSKELGTLAVLCAAQISTCCAVCDTNPFTLYVACFRCFCGKVRDNVNERHLSVLKEQRFSPFCFVTKLKKTCDIRQKQHFSSLTPIHVQCLRLRADS